MLGCCLLAVGCIFAGHGWGQATSSPPHLHIAVAANFRPTMQKLKPQLKAGNRARVTFSFSATGALFQQIVQGAPFDVFLAADSARPAALEKQNLILPGSRQTYALGRLVLYSNQADTNPEALLRRPDTRIAIANPQLAPYGQAALQTLQAWGLWPKVRSQLVYGKDIAQTFLFASTQHAQVAFVSEAQIKAFTAKGGQVARWSEVSNRLHSPIQQQLVVLARSKAPVAAKQFVRRLLAPESRLVIKRSGYRLPGLSP